jgi:hypothetical protein
MDDILADMFRRHRSDPEPTTTSVLRDRLNSVESAALVESRALDARLVRGRLTGSATIGLRDRLARQTLSAPRA